jgi:hypothetical protein
MMTSLRVERLTFLSTGPNRKAIKMSVLVHSIELNMCTQLSRKILAVKIAATKAPIGIIIHKLALRDIVGGIGGVPVCCMTITY